MVRCKCFQVFDVIKEDMMANYSPPTSKTQARSTILNFCLLLPSQIPLKLGLLGLTSLGRISIKMVLNDDESLLLCCQQIFEPFLFVIDVLDVEH